MSADSLDVTLLLGATVLLVAVTAVRLSTRVGLPSLLVYLLLGLLLGESGAGIRFDDAELAQALGLSALVVILAEGGLTTRWSAIRPMLPLAGVLATLGVAISIGVTAVIAHLVLDVSWRLALITGAVLSSTDAAAVFSTLRNVPLPPRLAGVLEAESGLNDAPAVIAVVLLSSSAWDETSPLALAGLMVYELAAGTVIGVGSGILGTAYLRRIRLPSSGLYPLAVVGFAVLGYAVAGVAHASGFVAVYLAALRLGNAGLPYRVVTRSFTEGLAWLAQIGLFVMLGLLASPSRLPEAILPALAVGAGLLLVARPLSVLASATPFRLPLREQGFLSWAGLRGAVPIVLATIPITEAVDGSERLFDVVFVLVVVFTLVQGPTLASVAARLGVSAQDETREVVVESAPLEELHAELLQLSIPSRSRLAGVEVSELRLPAGAAVTLVVREGASFVPTGSTRLDRGDCLLIVATAASRDAAESRLRAVSRAGKLAGWIGQSGRDTRMPGPRT